MTSLNVRNCVEYSVWCGKDDVPKGIKDNKIYYKKGSGDECLKIGIGAGVYSERRKNLSRDDLLQIKYLNETYKKKFVERGIKTTNALIKKTKLMSADQKRELFRFVFKKGKVLDKRAYNSAVLFLHSNGVGNLPGCSLNTLKITK